MLEFLVSHPFYFPFIALNIFIIYKVIKNVLKDEKGENEDDDEGGISDDDQPILDLPPGVILPVLPKEPVIND